MLYRFLGATGLAGFLALSSFAVLAQDEAAGETGEAPAAEAAEAPAEEGAGATAAADAGDPVVAVVNGETLRRSDVVASARNLPEQYQQQIDQLFPALVERLIDLNLLAAEAERQGLADDAEVENRVEHYREQAMREVMIDRFLRDAVADDQVQSRYDELVAAMPREEEVHARHILVESEEEARQIIAQLGEGAAFEELAREHSTDGAAQAGGDLGYFTRQQMVPEFAEAAFAMEEGAHSAEPVQTQFGWHVIKVEDRRTQEPPPLEEVRGDIEEELSREAISTWVAELRSAATIERFNPDGTPVVEAPEEAEPEVEAPEPEEGEDAEGAEDAAE